MPEPITTISLTVLAYANKDIIGKILGPTADYLGESLREFAQKRAENVGKIFRNAETKLGDKINQPGQVPPKVLKTIINEGSYSDDEIAVEYFGGILASSRTEQSRDDRGSRVAKEIDNLSCYQLKCHYLIYSTVSTIFRAGKSSIALQKNRDMLKIFMPLNEFVHAMELSQKEWDNPQLLNHIFHGLSSDGLIEDIWAFGSVEVLKSAVNNKTLPCQGIVCTPTFKGAELFLWGFGYGSKELEYIFSNEFNSVIEGIPSFVQGSIATKT